MGFFAILLTDDLRIMKFDSVSLKHSFVDIFYLYVYI